MIVTKKPLEYHKCFIPKLSQSCLPDIPPQSGRLHRLLRRFKKYFLVYEKHYQTKKCFRSTAMILQERKRHIRTSSWYIIHPFSKISIFLEVLMSLCWTLTFFLDSLNFGFYTHKERTHNPVQNALSLFFDCLNYVFVGIFFFYGYYNVASNEIILDQKKITINYISTYLCFDIVGSLPIRHVIISSVPFRLPVSITLTDSILKQLRFVRLKTTIEFSKQLFALLGVDDLIHKIFTLFLIIMVLIHWSACLLYVVPRLEHNYQRDWSTDSWVYTANLTNCSTSRRYVVALHIAVCHFLNTGKGMIVIKDKPDQLVCSFITVLGYLFTLYTSAHVLQLVSSSTASESKYEELVHTLNEYSTRKKLPIMLKSRLLLYYEHRFQKRYFKESVILATLSEHLRYEILLHTCKHLFNKLHIFHGLSKQVIGTIIACLKQEVFLPNDVVMRADTPAECMYLVGYGTLAIYTFDGLEIVHVEDGDHFGETSLLRPDSDRQLNIVAVETSEVYKLDKQDFFYLLNAYDTFAERVQKIVAQRIDLVRKLQDHLARLRGKHDVINDLRHGKILEKSYKRQARYKHKP